jgi:DNA-binding response OmpR family regulator
MNPLRILCIDDDSALLRMLAAGLEFHGFKVVTACDGIEAVVNFRENEGRFDAIVTDRDLPEMNGFEVARMVRDEGFTGPIYMMSGRPAAYNFSNEADLRLTGFLQKPFTVSLLTLMMQNDLAMKG